VPTLGDLILLESKRLRVTHFAMSATVTPNPVLEELDLPGDPDLKIVVPVVPVPTEVAEVDGWVAVENAQGDTYYWHTGTDETTWERPAGYIHGEGTENKESRRASYRRMSRQAWISSQQVRIDDVLEQNRVDAAKAVGQKERKGSVLFETMVGIRKSAGLRKQSVTEIYLKLKNRVNEELGRKKNENHLLKIEPATETDDDKIEYYLTGENAARKRAAMASHQVCITTRHPLPRHTSSPKLDAPI
jgi:hypothetical protein